MSSKGLGGNVFSLLGMGLACAVLVLICGVAIAFLVPVKYESAGATEPLPKGAVLSREELDARTAQAEANMRQAKESYRSRGFALSLVDEMKVPVILLGLFAVASVLYCLRRSSIAKRTLVSMPTLLLILSMLLID